MSDFSRGARLILGIGALLLGAGLAALSDPIKPLWPLVAFCGLIAGATLLRARARHFCQAAAACVVFVATTWWLVDDLRHGRFNAVPSFLLFGLPALVFALGRWPQPRDPGLPSVTIDVGDRVHVTTARETFAFSAEEITAVDMLTTDGGPWLDDVYWRIATPHGEHVFPCRNDQALIEWLTRRLDGFDVERLVTALGSTANARFPLWPRAASHSPASDVTAHSNEFPNSTSS